MSSPAWSVRFALENHDANALSAVGHTIFTREVHRLSFADPREDGEPATMTLELEASDANTARVLAQHLLDKAKRRLGLPLERSPVVWVAPLLPTHESSHRFFDAAEELIDAERYDLAVVALQIHLEVHVFTLVRAALAADASLLADAVVKAQRVWAPHSNGAAEIRGLLLGTKMTSFPRWADYMAHVKRRGDVVHRGQPIDEDSARASLDVVSELWLWLNARAADAAGRERGGGALL